MFRSVRRCFSSVRLAYLSDVHLEVNTFKKPFEYRNSFGSRQCHGIILAGDIGKVDSADYESFLVTLEKEFGQVFLVPGNHEYWDRRGYFWINDKLRELEKGISGLHVLINGESRDLKLNGVSTNIRLIGGTLWSLLPSTRFKDNYPKMKDLTELYFEEGKAISPQVYNELFFENLMEFTDEFDRAESDGKQIVAVSHHAPMVRYTCHPRYLGLKSYPYGNRWSNKQFRIDRQKFHNFAFSTDIDLLFHPNLRAWIFGHTHFRCAYHLPGNNCFLASNPLGFHQKGKTPRFPQIYRDFYIHF